ncbi:hypothetical protein L1987_40205 [Smallanthus sonchifolius]|uniref:Uncharacterized protein n=1 Tax=Smallanthus sonchifolius TaxID=185202 RepID=A0ACB9GSS4_9ASTR|nr:hypothetical protein L1987_40205 [Smallanthus sonchifolius]
MWIFSLHCLHMLAMECSCPLQGLLFSNLFSTKNLQLAASMHLLLLTITVVRFMYYSKARLMPKDVVKCKSVCREWRVMLSTQEFERAHCSRSSVPSSQRTLFIRESNCSVYPMDFETGDYGPPAIIPFPLNVGLIGVAILAYLDGLLCVCLHQTSELVLWNPTTNAYKHMSTHEGHRHYTDIADTCWVVGRNLLIGFDTTTEQLKEISF